MMELRDALALLTGRVKPLAPVVVSLTDALGCRLAETPHADVDLPSADVSVMDGYAARADDLRVSAALPVAFEVPAGRTPPRLPSGLLARIFTGAEIPAGADTVVPQEQADVRPDGSVCLAALDQGSFVRPKAEVCTTGTRLAEVGEVITPQLVSLLGAAGGGRVRITPRPRVALLSTGSELVSIHERPAPGQIRNSNGVMMVALARVAGFEVTFTACVVDESAALRDAVRQAIGAADLVVTSGGVSVGDYDLVPQTLADLGGETLFHRLAIKPGKPVLTARVGEAWVVGLPGNPISALVGWELFARPLGERLAGDARAFDKSPQRGVLTGAARNRGDRTMFASARVQPGSPLPKVTVLPGKGSHDVLSVARANALAILEKGVDLAAEQEVSFYRLNGSDHCDQK